MDFSHLYLSTEGRIGRKMFWIGHLILAGIGIVLNLIFAGMVGPLSFTARLISLIFILIVAYPAYAVSAKRFQDRNKNGALGAILISISVLSTLFNLLGVTGNPFAPNALGMILGLAAMGVGIWYLIELGILRGTAGANQYGPDPVG